jgi:sirohydrochlorin cobaltochelatase
MKATLLFAHGSRDPAWRAPMDNVARRMLEINPAACVRCAFLELTQPDIFSVVNELLALDRTHFTIVPMFLGVGKHAREDMPLLLAQLQQRHPQAHFVLKMSIGEDPRVIELLANIALDGDPL